MQRGTCNKDEHRPPFMLGLVRFSSGVNIRSVRTFPSQLARSSAPFGLESRTWVSNDFPSFLSQFLLISISLFSVYFSILLSGLTSIPIKAKIRKTYHPCIFPPCRTTRIVTMTPKKKKNAYGSLNKNKRQCSSPNVTATSRRTKKLFVVYIITSKRTTVHHLP